MDAIGMLAAAVLHLGLSPADAVKVDPKEVLCLADTVYFEAQGEPAKGKEGVAAVTLTRRGMEAYPDTICGVVHQKTKVRTAIRKVKMVPQYSWTNKPVRVNDPEEYEESIVAAVKVMYGKVPDPTRKIGGATHFFAHNIVDPPNWAETKLKVKIGNHTFVRVNN